MTVPPTSIVTVLGMKHSLVSSQPGTEEPAALKTLTLDGLGEGVGLGLGSGGGGIGAGESDNNLKLVVALGRREKRLVQKSRSITCLRLWM